MFRWSLGKSFLGLCARIKEMGGLWPLLSRMVLYVLQNTGSMDSQLRGAEERSFHGTTIVFIKISDKSLSIFEALLRF